MASKATAVFTFKGAGSTWTLVALCVCEYRQFFFSFVVELLSVNLILCVCLCVFVLAFHIYSLHFEHLVYVCVVFALSHTHLRGLTRYFSSDVPRELPKTSIGNDFQHRIPQCILCWAKFIIYKDSLINKLYNMRVCVTFNQTIKYVSVFQCKYIWTIGVLDNWIWKWIYFFKYHSYKSEHNKIKQYIFKDNAQ